MSSTHLKPDGLGVLKAVETGERSLDTRGLWLWSLLAFASLLIKNVGGLMHFGYVFVDYSHTCFTVPVQKNSSTHVFLNEDKIKNNKTGCLLNKKPIM